MVTRFVCYFWLVCSAVFAMTAQARPFDENKLNRYLDSLYQYDKAMLSVAIAERGEITFSHQTGTVRALSNGQADTGKSADKESQYRVGSVTKTLTATLIFQLIEKGKLALDTSLATFFPDVKNAEAMTIDHLLSHQSGIANYTDTAEFAEKISQFQSQKQMLGWIQTLPSDFAPGSRFAYSNTNYLLLTYIIETLSGMPFEAYAEQQIFTPLGMQHSLICISNQCNDASHSFLLSFDWQTYPHWNMSLVRGAGAMMTTPEELARLGDALFSGKLVSDASLNQMKGGGVVGRGLFPIPFADNKGFGHDGKIEGYFSMLAHFPQDDVTLAVSINGLNTNSNDILIGILSIYFDKPFDLPEFKSATQPENTADLLRYQGHYQSESFPLDIDLFVRDGRLFAQATGQSAFPLDRITPVKFSAAPFGITMNFKEITEEHSQHAEFNFTQGALSATFVRQSEQTDQTSN